jgi:nucleoside-diphosphate-sugar epimerase
VKITVFGGSQIRPNIHIDDICDLYIFMLQNPKFDGIFNAGFENISILDIAHMIKDKVPCDIVVTASNDLRSYRLDSTKLLNTGFAPKKSVRQAILDIIRAHESWGVKLMKNISTI